MSYPREEHDEIEASIARTNAECEAEELGINISVYTVPVVPAITQAIGRLRHKLNDDVSLWLDFPEGDPAPPYTELDVAACARWMWAFGHPFAADLLACAETNS